MQINISGAGWVTAEGFGSFKDGKPVLKSGPPVIPAGREVFSKRLSRYGRFDNYTKLGCAAAGLALREAQLDQLSEKMPYGIVVSSKYECLESDISFYNTTLEEQGFYSSPNLFSYTLPGIVIGECAIHFKLSGPTFTIGDESRGKYGYNALKTAADLLHAGVTETVLAGWLESPPDEFSDNQTLHGAVFLVLTVNPKHLKQTFIDYQNFKLLDHQNKEISSITDVFRD